MVSALRVVEQQDEMDRKKALEAALSQIDRAFGKGSVMKLGDKGKVRVQISIFGRATPVTLDFMQIEKT